jgi:hypothetical protein
MNKRLIQHDLTFITYDQSSKVSEPSDGAFNDPSFFVPAQLTAVLRRRFNTIDFVWADHFDAALSQPIPQRIRVIRSIENDALWIFARSSRATPRHRDFVQRSLQQFHLCRRGRFQVDSQRKTLAVSHHHPLCTIATFGFTHAEPPFFAGAKLPSAKISAQQSWPSSSNSASKARHALNQIPCSSHSCNRRQHVVGEGYSSGRSFQRAPLRRTHKIPSNTGRLSRRVRPPLDDRFGFGNSGSIFTHCSSVSSVLSLAIANSFRKIWPVNHKFIHGANLRCG